MSSRHILARPAVIWSCILGLLHTLAGAAAGQAAPGTTLTFSSLADTYVDAGAATTNFNTATQLRADASPVRIIYLRFAVTGVNGRPVDHARLRLEVSGASPSGGMVHRISNDTWNEATVTYNTRPALDGPALATLGAVTTGAVAEFDLDGAVPGDGVYDLAIDSTSSSAVGYVAAAATSGQKPQLVLTVAESAPIVSILQPPPGTTFFVGDPITLQGFAASSTGADLSSAIAWSSSRQGLLGSGAVVTTALAAGDHTVTASVVDSHGLVGSDHVDLTVQPLPGVNTEPLVTITAPLEGKTFAAGTPIVFTATAADLENGDLTARLVWTSDRDGVLGTGGSVTRTLSEGTHDVVASATDDAGLRGEHRVTVHVQTPTALEFTPSADASVDAGATSTNYGTSPILRVDTNTERLAYLRFDVTGIGARQVVGARLRLQLDAASGADSDRGGTLRTITNHAWQETGITYANRPALDGPVLASLGPVVHGQSVDFDTSAAVTGNGRYDFALVGDSSDEATYRSREGGPAPRLIVLVTGSVPAVTITAPAGGAIYLRNDSITFTARATDAEDGDLGTRIRWTSSRDGSLGTGPAIGTATLSVGTHTITAAATDASNLRGEARITVRVRDPNAPPSVRITAPADGATVPAGSSLTLGATAVDDFDGSIPGRITWTSDRDGALGAGPARTVVLSEGPHTVTARAVDSDGAAGAALVHVTVTPTPPVVAITAPPSGATAFAGTPLTFRGTAHDATDGDLGAALRWTSDRDGPIGTGASVTTAGLRVGTHVVTAAATDAGGLAAQAQETIVIRPPNVPPVLTIVAPAAGSALLASAPVLLDATAVDAEDGDITGAIAWTSSRDGALGTGGTRVVPTLSLGSHVLTATITDHDTATATASVTVNVTAATLSFVAVADTYVDAANPTSKFGTATSLTVDGSPVKQAFLRFAPTGLGTLSIKTGIVRLTAGSASAASSNAGGTLRLVSNGTWSESTTTYNTRPAVDGAPLATRAAVALKQVVDFDVTSALHGDGTYNFGLVTSSSDDVIYQSREASSGRPLLVVTFGQNQAPAVRITAPASGTRVGEGVPVALRGTATDAEDGDLASRIEWSSNLDGALGTGAAPVVATLRPGVHTITAQARDAGGLSGRATITLTVTHRPLVRITAPADGAVVFVPALPLRLVGEAADAEDGDLGGRLAWRSDLDGPLGSGPSVAAATLRLGTHVITAAATDADGLTTEAHITIRVRLPNTPPAVVITSPSAARPAPTGTALAFTGSATDDFDGDVSSRLRWTSSRDGLLGAGASITTPPLSTGTHVVRATATDTDGETGVAERTVVVRGPNAPPVVAIVSPAAGAIAVGGKPVALVATASDAEDGDLRPAVRWSSNRDGVVGTGASLVVGTLSVGTHVLSASATDGDGATSTATIGLTVELSAKTFLPVADTYVDSGSTTKVFGTATGLIIGTSTVRQALLRFTVTGIAPLKVEHAVLRLTVGSGSGDGGSVGGTLRRITSSLWSESATTYKTRPAQDGPVLGTQGTVTPNQVVDFDVTAGVTGNGTYDFGLTSTSSNWVKYLSRESATGKPQLILTLTGDLPPVVQIETPLPGAVVDVGVPVDLAATATDAESGDLTGAIRWTSSRDGALGTGGRLRKSSLTAGTHTLTASATDGGANTASTSVALVVNATPTVAITAPASGDVFEPGSPVTLAGTALDAEDGNLGAAIAWTSDRDGALGTGSPLTTSHLRTGSHLITASVTDRNGASARATMSIVVDARPTIALTAPGDGTTFSPGDVIALTATANDAEEGDLQSAVRWTSDLDGALGTGSPLVVRTLRSGAHRITALVSDTGGKNATATITLRVNAAPTIAITGPATGAVFSPGAPVALVATATDLEDGDLGGAVAWTSSLDGPLGTGRPLVVSTLRSGRHVLTATVTDAGGKVATAGITVVVDTAPTLAITLPGDGAMFSPGEPIILTASAHDAEDGDLGHAVVWTSDPGGALGSGSPLVIPMLGSGTYRITATVTDAGGKQATAAITLRVNAAPTIAITGPAPEAVFSPGEPVTLTATAADSEDDDLGGTVVWASSLDGRLGTGTPLVVSTLRSGRHVLTATVIDAGGKFASAEIAVVVNAAPIVAVTAPGDSATVSPGEPITLTASAHDVEDGDLGPAVVWTSDPDGPLGTGSPLVIPTLGSGAHRITATVTDAGGKHATAAITLRVNAAPTIALIGPASEAVFAPGEPVTLTATAADLEDGDLGATVVWTSSLDGPLGTGSPLVVATLRSGLHVLTATATDAGGKVASAGITVVVNAAPTVAIILPTDGASFSQGDPIPLTAAAHDAEDGDLGSAVRWTSDVDGVLGAGSPLVVHALRPGPHRITAAVTDAGGKQATAAIILRLDAAPTITITGPMPGAVYSPGEPVTLTATAGDPEDGDLGAAIVWTSSLDGPLGTGSSLVAAMLHSGVHAVTATVTDAAGKVATAGITVVVNAAPTLAITLPADGASFSQGDPIPLTAAAHDAEDGDLGSAVRWTSDVDGVLGAGSPLVVHALRPGPHRITAAVTDAGGKQATASITLRLDAVPTITITGPMPGAVYSPGEPVTLTATAGDLEDGDLGATVAWSSSLDGPLGTGSPLVAAMLHSGLHAITATVTDADGKVATAGITLVVNAAPILAITLPVDGATFSRNEPIALIATAYDAEDGELANAVTWTSDLDGVLGGGSPLVVNTLRSGTHRITAAVSDTGGRHATATITLGVNTAPTIAIASPEAGAVFSPGEPVVLVAAATDLEDGDLGGAVAWTSSLDGPVGTGSPLVVSTLRSGLHVLTATVTDAGGKVASAGITVAVNAPPTVAVTAPGDGAMFLPGEPITLTASAHDAEDGELADAVTWTSDLDGVLGGGSPLVLDTLRSGTHRITAAVSDTGGRHATATITLGVNTAPTIAIAGPETGAVFSPGDPVTLVATATDLEDGDLGGAVAWTSSLDGPLGTGSPLVRSTLRSGLHVLTATVTDAGGKVASAGITVVVNAGPTLVITLPGDGAMFSPGEPIPLTASAHDVEDGDLGHAVVWTSDPDGPLGSGSPLVVPTLGSGAYRITATVTDAGGKHATAAITLRVNAAPTIAITGPAPEAVFSPGEPVTLTATAGDLEDGDLGATVVWASSLDGALGTGSPLVVSTLRSGRHVLTATVTDAGGKDATAAVTVVVNAAPTVAIILPADGATFSQGDPIPLTASAHDTEDGDLGSAVRWTSDLDGVLGAGSPLVVHGLRPGGHRIAATVTDAGGKQATAAITLRLNAVPTIAITGPAPEAVFAPGEPVTLLATAGDLEDGDLGATVAWSSSLDGPLGTGSPLVAAMLHSGLHAITAIVTDADGKVATAGITLVVNAAPTLAITLPVDGATFSRSEPIALTATAHDAEDGELADAVTWTSDLDGVLGGGSPLVVNTLRSGTHRVTAEVSDAGGKHAEATVMLRVNTAPTIAIAGPETGAVFSPGEPVVLVAAATDLEDGDLGGAVAWTSSLDGPLGTGSPLVRSTLRSGFHIVTATITDAGGRTSTAAIAVVVNAAPVVTITAPIDGATFSRGEPIALTATAHDVEDGELANAVTWTSDLDGVLGGGSPLVVDTLRSGTHRITAAVSDAGGRHTTATITLGVNTAPTIAIAGPETGAVFSPGEPVTLVATATDLEDGDLGATVAWTSSLDGPLGTGSPVVRSTLRSGLHVLTATVTDAGGKVASAGITVVVNAAPTLAITLPGDGAMFSPGEPITLTASAHDAEDGNLGHTVVWTAAPGGRLGSGSSLVVPTLGSGTYRITATVTDAGGKQATAAITLGVNAAPTIAITGPLPGAVFSPGEPVTLTATAGDLEDGDRRAAIVWTSSLDGPLGTGSPLVAAMLHSGLHAITATVTDGAGKVATAGITVIVNAAPTLAITLPVDGATFSSGDPIALTAAAHDTEDGDLGSAVRWTSDLDGVLGAGSPLVVHALRPGLHRITAAVTDAGGKQATAAITLRLNAVPTIAIAGPATGTAFLPGAPVTLTATADDLEDGDLRATVVWASNLDGPLGSGSPLVVSTLRSGRHVLTATVTDAARKVATAGITVVVNTAPTVTVTAPNDGLTFSPGDAITLTAAAHDAEDGDLGSAVTWTSDLDGALGTGSPLVVHTLHSGTHVITAAVTDASGARTVAHVGLVVNGAPSVTITTPADGSTALPGHALVLSGNASDVEDGEVLNTTNWSSSLDGFLGVGASLTVTSLRPGTHTITASITDTGGRQATARVTLLVNTPPSVTISTPAGGARFSRGDPVTLGATGSDAEDGVLTSAITWTSSVDGVLGTGGTVTVNTLHAGTHVLRALVTDGAGVQASAQVQVVINPALTIAITSPLDGTILAPDEGTGLAGTANDSEDGDLGAAISWTSSLDGSLGTGRALAVGPLRSGTHAIRATVTDSGGQSASAAITIVVAPLVTLQGTSSGNYNPQHLIAKTKIDATQATFLASPANLYPINVGGDPGIRILGGRILGQYDRTLGWDEMHSMNNAGVALNNDQSTVDGFRIDNVTDGFRPRPGNMFTIRNAWLSYIRDDCVENDYVSAGLVDDSLFDGCYVAFSARPSAGLLAAGYNGRNNLWTIQNSLMRLAPMPGPREASPDNLGNGEFFKWHLWDRPNDSVSPRLALHNNVFMAERAGQTADRMGVPPGKLESCSNNVMVWLGPGAFPGPPLPSCFTVTTNRAVWDDAVAAWKARHPGMAP